MICKTCKNNEVEADEPTRPGSTENNYGWHPMFGDCWLCFTYSMFGPVMEPWGPPHVRATQRYQITPPGVPSKCNCVYTDKDLDDWIGIDIDEILDDWRKSHPEEDLPF